jgi:hypothetical protein
MSKVFCGMTLLVIVQVKLQRTPRLSKKIGRASRQWQIKVRRGVNENPSLIWLFGPIPIRTLGLRFGHLHKWTRSFGIS